MELNGLANLKILLDELTSQLPNDNRLLYPTAKMYQQLELLNRYMIAYESWAQGHLKEHALDYHHVVTNKPPFWHEVLANPKNFPTNHERLNGLKQKGQTKV